MDRPGLSLLLGRSRTAKILRTILGWTLLSTVFTVQSYYLRVGTPAEDSWWHIWTINEVYFLLWGAMTPLIVFICDRFRFERGKVLSTVFLYAVAGVAIAAVQRVVSDVITFSLPSDTPTPVTVTALVRSLLASVDYGIFLYVIIVFVHYAAEYNRRYVGEKLKASRLSADLASAQLQSLRMQLHPHFLFNTLNAVSVLIREDPERAHAVLGQLSDLLRLSMAHVDAREVPLREELEFLDLYLRILQTRFGDRLTVERKIHPSVTDALVPYLILQPLVENAMTHGIGKHPGPGTVEISAERSNGMLLMRVADSGPGFSSHGLGTLPPGIGLANTQARLKNLYGDAGFLELTNIDGTGGARVTIGIPFHHE